MINNYQPWSNAIHQLSTVSLFPSIQVEQPGNFGGYEWVILNHLWLQPVWTSVSYNHYTIHSCSCKPTIHIGFSFQIGLPEGKSTMNHFHQFPVWFVSYNHYKQFPHAWWGISNVAGNFLSLLRAALSLGLDSTGTVSFVEATLVVLSSDGASSSAGYDEASWTMVNWVGGSEAGYDEASWLTGGFQHFFYFPLAKWLAGWLIFLTVQTSNPFTVNHHAPLNKYFEHVWSPTEMSMSVERVLPMFVASPLNKIGSCWYWYGETLL